MTRASLPLSAVRGLDPSDAALLETLLAKAPLAFAFFDTRSRFRRVNQSLAILDGRPVDDHFGRRPGDLLDPGLAATLQEPLSIVLDTDEQLTEWEFSVEPSAGDDKRRHWLSSWFPAHARNGDTLGVAVFAVDVTESRRSEEELRRSWERYRSLAQASGQAVWVASPAGGINEDSREWHAITGQTFEEYAGDGWLDAVHRDDRPDVEGEWRRAVRTGGTFHVNYRLWSAAGECRNYETRAIPITRDGDIVEWVAASTDVTATREIEAMRERLNQQLSAAALRTARLQQVTSRLAEALTVDEVTRTVVEVGQSALGVERTVVALYDKNRDELRVVNDEAPESPADHGRVISPGNSSVLACAVRAREFVLASSPEELRKKLPDTAIDDFLQRTEERTWIGLPLLASGDPVGALRLSFTRPHPVSEEERTFMQALASQCALAVERATLYEREHRTAETLQRTLLPGRLPQPPGFTLASRYHPAGPGLRVGGDWYDAFEVPDGRLAVVVGDVMGKGVRAAAGMGRVRSALRALALSDPEPTTVLTGLDTLFAATEETEQITTVLYCLLDVDTNELRLGNAGHPQPLIISPITPARVVSEEPGRPLGAPAPSSGNDNRQQQYLRLSPAEMLVAFSDGLVENRHRNVYEGLRELEGVAAGADPTTAGDPHALLDYLYQHMLPADHQDDDVTLLALHAR